MDNQPPQSKFPYYFIATINGVPVRYEADDFNSVYGCGTSQPESTTDPDYDIYEGTVIANPNDFTRNLIRVHILKHFDHDPSSAERAAMIKIGSYPYGFSDVGSATVNGASIDYIDASGDDWDTQSGPQSGSTFSITDLKENNDGTSGKIFTATFSCKLYDGLGNSKQVQDATIRGKILSP